MAMYVLRRSQLGCAHSIPHRRLRVRDLPFRVMLTGCDAMD